MEGFLSYAGQVLCFVAFCFISCCVLDCEMLRVVWECDKEIIKEKVLYLNLYINRYKVSHCYGAPTVGLPHYISIIVFVLPKKTIIDYCPYCKTYLDPLSILNAFDAQAALLLALPEP